MSKCLARQGIKIPIRKELRTRRGCVDELSDDAVEEHSEPDVKACASPEPVTQRREEKDGLGGPTETSSASAPGAMQSANGQ
jgi:hypothetical protein